MTTFRIIYILVCMGFFLNIYSNQIKAWWMRNVSHRKEKFKMAFSTLPPFKLFDAVISDIKGATYLYIGNNYFIEI